MTKGHCVFLYELVPNSLYLSLPFSFVYCLSCFNSLCTKCHLTPWVADALHNVEINQSNSNYLILGLVLI